MDRKPSDAMLASDTIAMSVIAAIRRLPDSYTCRWGAATASGIRSASSSPGTMKRIAPLACESEMIVSGSET